ncbi:AMP-binding protein [Candidatus Poribacteria bacterium]|nr:AMP-binding protein [Candidatus Poribacteria bacterium]
MKRVQGTLLNDFLERSANMAPEKTALICGKQRSAYARIDAAANQLANALRAHGVEKGDRIAVFLDNSPEAVISIFGIVKAGAAFVPINPQTRSQKLCFILNNCRAVGFVTHSKYVLLLQDVERDVPSLKFAVVCGDLKNIPQAGKKNLSMQEILETSSATPPAPDIIDLDLAAIIYTSGTTGFPKGACFTHRAMVSATSSITTYLKNVESDIILNVLPLSFGYGLSQVLTSSRTGATLVLEKSFAYPYQTIQVIKQEKVTGFAGVPTIFAMLLALKDVCRRDFDSVRYITNAAAALPPRHILQLKEMFSRAMIYSMYGVTECTRVSYMPPDDLDKRPASVGKGIPNQETYIVDENGNRVGPEVVGELVVRGSHVMMGYWEMPEENKRALREGRYPGERVLYTGDLFRMDNDGYLYFVSRKDDIIKSRGEKVAPTEVEHIIYELPQVLEVAIVGIPDDILGEAVKAFVVLKDGMALTERDVATHCSRRLESFMVPKHVEFVSGLPKTSSGKICRRDLRVASPDAV